METVKMRLAASFAAGAVLGSARTGAVAALFGMPLEGAGRVVFSGFDFALRAGTVTLIMGPSGSGKSTLLRAIGEGLRAGHPGMKVVRLEEIGLPGDRAVVDCFGCSLEGALGFLSRAGLSEAHTLLRSPAELSEGQQFRFRVAQFMASEAEVLLADEFCATLDRITARLVSWQLQKFIHGAAGGGKSVIAATTHGDLADDLHADVSIYKGLGEELRVVGGSGGGGESALAKERGLTPFSGEAEKRCLTPFSEGMKKRCLTPFVGGSSLHGGFRILAGTVEDYRRLKGFHYREGNPGAVKRVFKVVYEPAGEQARCLRYDEGEQAECLGYGEGEQAGCLGYGGGLGAGHAEREMLAGVAVESLPALGCALRRMALPGVFDLKDRSLAAGKLNRDMRTISRVIVHPVFRSAGLAVALVRHVLEHAETPYVEALAAMGRVHPFFRKAGMMEFDRPPLEGHVRLTAALAHEGFSAMSLVEAKKISVSGFLRKELERFAGLAGGTDEELIECARRRLLSQPVYYLWSRGKNKSQKE